MKKLILLLLFGIILIGGVFAESTFTPIFCNDYEFTGCYADESTSSYQISDEESWVCPGYASKCEILSVSDGEEWLVGSGNCYLDTGDLCHGWTCNNEQSGKRQMNTGENVYLESECRNPTAFVEVKITEPILKFSGTSCGAGGLPVSGVHGCTFSPNGGIIYSSDEMTNPQYKNSYTVPLTEGSPTCVMSWVSGKRHICGYKEESCFSDLDCEGHTYENKECFGKTLQTYGCRNYGSEPGKLTEISEGLLNLDGDTAGTNNPDNQIPLSGNANFGNRCEIITTEQVQCCGDTDCGTNMFCDTSTFTCREQIQCEEDYDCGVSEQCDWTVNILKNPICIDGQCNYEETKVDCCLDKNCDEGTFCNNNHKCEIGSGHNIYAENSNASNLQGSLSQLKSNSSTGIIILVILFILIGGTTGFFIYVKSKKGETKDSANKEEPKDQSEKCSKCGHEIKKGSKFCTKCGHKLRE